MTGIARQYHHQLVHFMRKTVNYNDTGISAGVVMGTLPAGAQIIGAVCNVVTAFNAASTNVLTCGTDASFLNIVTASDVTEGSAAGSALITSGTGLSFTTDTDVTVKYAQTGTAATTGKAVITILYSPNNDL